MAEQDQPPERRGYDVEMIRDFLDHLRRELRISHSEVQAQVEREPRRYDIDPESAERLAKYREGRRKGGLLYVLAVGDAVSEGVAARLVAALEGMRAEQLRHFEALSDLFKEALDCATSNNRFLIRDIDDVEAEIRRMLGETG
jgi:hypothetical protein